MVNFFLLCTTLPTARCQRGCRATSGCGARRIGRTPRGRRRPRTRRRPPRPASGSPEGTPGARRRTRIPCLPRARPGAGAEISSSAPGGRSSPSARAVSPVGTGRRRSPGGVPARAGLTPAGPSFRCRAGPAAGPSWTRRGQGWLLTGLKEHKVGQNKRE